MSGVRVDVWLSSVRLTPTRSAASALCRSSRVIVNGATAKAASTVKPGDRVEARIGQRRLVVEVVQAISKRVGAPIAASCFTDHSPLVVSAAPPPVVRDRGLGRPTKRDRRRIDRLTGT